MIKFIILLIRYLIAVAVACFVSFAIVYFTFNPPLAYLGALGPAIFLILLPCIGFCGVLSGTLCLPRSKREAGSIVLLGLGAMFCEFLWIYIDTASGTRAPILGAFIVIVPIAAGGFGAVSIFNRWRFKIQTNQKPDPSYQGLRCVSCEKPISLKEKNCPNCGYTQPFEAS
ncbi:MAG TPA: hypothetical protein VGN23_16330 [Verrucomicrobiae bacterium]|jgi:apolipoprotein N-acyltransferase